MMDEQGPLQGPELGYTPERGDILPYRPLPVIPLTKQGARYNDGVISIPTKCQHIAEPVPVRFFLSEQGKLDFANGYQVALPFRCPVTDTVHWVGFFWNDEPDLLASA